VEVGKVTENRFDNRYSPSTGRACKKKKKELN